jgi:hypothetical protein
VNNFIYKKDEIIITNKISAKTLAKGKMIIAYEFETGR